MTEIDELLMRKGVRPTPNRILVLRTLLQADAAMSLTELESALLTMDRSSIFRTLTILTAHDILHSIEDGEGIIKYEICTSPDNCSVDDMHIHFYCRICHHTYCFPAERIPAVQYPEGFTTESVNYMAKGICAGCQGKSSNEHK